MVQLRFGDPQVSAYLAVVDLTNPSQADTQRAERYGVRGIPALIKFAGDGKEFDRTNYRPAGELPQLLRPAARQMAV